MEAESPSDMAPSQVRDFGRALCVITGASRGFGWSLAREIAALLKPGSVLLLVARSGDKLRELQADLASSEAGKAGLLVRCVVADLGHKEGVESVIREVRETPGEDLDHLLLFNNAASLGDVSRYAQSFTDMDEVDSYLSFNVSSALCLTSSILGQFPQRSSLRRCVVNVSSLCAVKPFPSWVLYCTGKAARDMMFRVLAEEEPELRVLNYAPGPLDTDMQLQARSSSADPNMRNSFADMHSQGRLLTCEESVAKLIKVLLEDDYPSGAHLDFYDL
ncbi:sepiapterin reductase a [Colossoma macropomum]|uniref:sepiapterin reductase a n=1 Tax=Colossoma macropomum TaxID=42526 RepID=UPI0018645D0D|nr:sepiapterin reductase a [Colossoma macropomum]